MTPSLAQTSVLLFLLGGASAFAPSSILSCRYSTKSLLLHEKTGHEEVAVLAEEEAAFTAFLNRRSLLQNAVLVSLAAATCFSSSRVLAAETDSGMGREKDHPITVIGAGGKCGILITKILQSSEYFTRAVTRSGRTLLSNSSGSDFVSYASGDVTDYESIKSAIQGSSGVIFAASASGKKKGGDPAHVDYLGLYNVAKSCLECNVPKLVVISAGSVTRPDFVGFKATNFFVKYVYGDKIMDYKIAGESAMRDLYQAQTTKKCAYCVIRPGGLSDNPSEGPTALHVSQGDVYSSEVSRRDVAQVAVSALTSAATDFTTLELNNKKGLSKVSDKLKDPPSELVHAGASTFEGLLDGLLTDQQLRTKFPEYLNDFRGDNIEPISSLT